MHYLFKARLSSGYIIQKFFWETCKCTMKAKYLNCPPFSPEKTPSLCGWDGNSQVSQLQAELCPIQKEQFPLWPSQPSGAVTAQSSFIVRELHLGIALEMSYSAIQLYSFSFQLSRKLARGARFWELTISDHSGQRHNSILTTNDQCFHLTRSKCQCQDKVPQGRP